MHKTVSIVENPQMLPVYRRAFFWAGGAESARHVYTANQKNSRKGGEMNIFRKIVMRRRDELPPVRVRSDGLLVLTPGVDFREPGQRNPYARAGR